MRLFVPQRWMRQERQWSQGQGKPGGQGHRASADVAAIGMGGVIVDSRRESRSQREFRAEFMSGQCQRIRPGGRWGPSHIRSVHAVTMAVSGPPPAAMGSSASRDSSSHCSGWCSGWVAIGTYGRGRRPGWPYRIRHISRLLAGGGWVHVRAQGHKMGWQNPAIRIACRSRKTASSRTF